jgi:3-hydroxy-9,10-secoandrosta-1,3,5(10)-triene-9,17-dione monooxygenase reductase component
MESVTERTAQAYRRALGAYPTGVAVITADLAVGAAAITVNSFVSISLDPPIVLWSLADSSDRYARFAGADRWGVSVLTDAQQGLAAIFAEKGARRAEDSEIERWADGAPILRDGLARFDCKTVQRSHVGDHLVIFGEVLAFDAREGAALTFHRGRFGRAD